MAKKRGRPTKLHKDIGDAIISNLSIGATYKDAAESAGITYNTFLNWLDKGDKAKSGIYYDFFGDVMQAQAEARLKYTKTIASAAAKGDWRAAESFLKRRDPENWGDKQGIDIKSDGEKIGLSDDKLERAVSTLADALGEIISGGVSKSSVDTAE